MYFAVDDVFGPVMIPYSRPSRQASAVEAAPDFVTSCWPWIQRPHSLETKFIWNGACLEGQHSHQVAAKHWGDSTTFLFCLCCWYLVNICTDGCLWYGKVFKPMGRYDNIKYHLQKWEFGIGCNNYGEFHSPRLRRTLRVSTWHLCVLSKRQARPIIHIGESLGATK